MQVTQSLADKPLYWNDNGANWSSLPVLAFPIRHGWALWQAIQERIEYLVDKHGAVVPDSLIGITGPFNPNADYKQMEWLMHNAIQWMLPNFIDFHTADHPYLTVESALSKIGDDVLIKPSPYFLSSKWLWQSYKLTSLLEAPPFFINIIIKDEGSPIFQSDEQESYFVEYKKYVTFRSAVFHTLPQPPKPIYAPANIDYYVYDPSSMDNFNNDLEQIKYAFLDLKEQYKYANDSDFILIISMSSLGYAGLLYEDFMDWKNSNHPNIRYILSTGTVYWLNSTKNIINTNRSLMFSANVTA